MQKKKPNLKGSLSICGSIGCSSIKEYEYQKKFRYKKKKKKKKKSKKIKYYTSEEPIIVFFCRFLTPF